MVFSLTSLLFLSNIKQKSFSLLCASTVVITVCLIPFLCGYFNEKGVWLKRMFLASVIIANVAIGYHYYLNQSAPLPLINVKILAGRSETYEINTVGYFLRCGLVEPRVELYG